MDANSFQPFHKDSELLQQNGSNGIHHNNIPSTSSSPFPDFTAQNMNNFANSNPQMRPTQPAHSLHSMNQWQGMQQSQNQHPAPMQHTQQLNTQWNNAVPQFPNFNGMNLLNGMPNLPMNMNMPAFNMPMFPQQMIQDALALSTPVAGPEDERVLIDALVEGRARKDNYKNALNSLHGRNGHSASLWKDFYLEHRDRIDVHVSSSLKTRGIEDPAPVTRAIKKPTINAFKSEPSPVSSPIPPLKRKVGRPVKASTSKSTISRSSSPIHKLPPAGSGRRTTINSLTVHTPSYNPRLPPPNAEIKIPDPPSRSPTPPTRIVPHHGRGNKFTAEDKDYFIKFIQWRLKCDPSLTRNDLCDQLAEKAPHHTVPSWYAYWSNNHDLPDKILAATYGEDEDEDEETEDESSEEEQKPRPPRRSKYKDISSSDEEDADGDEDDGAAETTSDHAALPSFDESLMGQRGGAFTDTDLAMTARYVASFDDFAGTPNRLKWVPWGQRYSQRSDKSWAEYYRRNERDILALAKKIKKAGAARGLSPKREPSESAARVALTWSSPTEASGPPKAKRKFVPDEEDHNDAGTKSKTSKVE